MPGFPKFFNKTIKKPLLLTALILALFLALTAGVLEYRRSQADRAKPLSPGSVRLLKSASERELSIRTDSAGSVTVRCAVRGDGKTYTVYQLPMTGNAGGCGYAIETPGGKFIMIDGGYAGESGYILDFIKNHGGTVDAWFVTHPHFDHVGALVDILSAEDLGGIAIRNVYYNPFTEDFFHKKEEGKDLRVLNNACLFDEFERLRASVTDVPFTPVEMGDNLLIDGMEVSCLFSFRPDVYDVNANSLVLHFNMKGSALLITGDITDYSVAAMREYWGADNACWDVDFMQIPHHGYIAGISGTALPQLAKPAYALLDCSAGEYDTNAVQIRAHEKWYQDLHIPVIKRFTGPNRIVVD